MRLRVASALAAVALLCAAGCSLLTSYDDFSGSGTASDGGGDATTGPADAGSLTEQTLCSPTIPGPPGGNQVGIGTTFDVYSGVVNALRFSQNLDGGCPILGKNLDGRNTGVDDAAPACANGFAAPVRDFEGGIDDQAQTGLQTLLLGGLGTAGLLSTTFIDNAQTGFVLSLTNWEGEANNPLVEVAFEADVGRADGGTLIDEKSVSTTGFHATLTVSGYVTNGVLVAPFGEQQLPLHFTAFVDAGPTPGINSVDIVVSNAYIIGHPVITGGGIAITDGQIVGRIRVQDLATALQSVFACTSKAYAPIICPELDLPLDQSEDGTDASCEALSFAFGFDLIPTTITGTGAAIAPQDFCLPTSAPVDNTLCAPAGSTPPDAGDAGDAGDGDDDDATFGGDD